MEIMFHTTRPFEKDIRKINKKEKNKIIMIVNQLANIYSNDKATFNKYAFRPMITLRGGLTSSLYIIRAGVSIRIICTIDEDSLFDQLIITLLRIAKSPDEYSKVFSQLTESLYHKNLIEYGNFEND